MAWVAFAALAAETAAGSLGDGARLTVSAAADGITVDAASGGKWNGGMACGMGQFCPAGPDLVHGSDDGRVMAV